jgi:hypothetical protein
MGKPQSLDFRKGSRLRHLRSPVRATSIRDILGSIEAPLCQPSSSDRAPKGSKFLRRIHFWKIICVETESLVDRYTDVRAPKRYRYLLNN